MGAASLQKQTASADWDSETSKGVPPIEEHAYAFIKLRLCTLRSPGGLVLNHVDEGIVSASPAIDGLVSPSIVTTPSERHSRGCPETCSSASR